MALSFTTIGATDSTEHIQQFQVTYTQYRTYHEPGMNTTKSTTLSIDHTGKLKVTTIRTDHKKRKPKEKKCKESASITKDKLAEFINKLDSLDIDSLQENYMGDRISDLTISEKVVIEIEKIKTEVTIEGADAEIPAALSSIIFFLEEMRKKYLRKCE
jgi:hypothetical protein